MLRLRDHQWERIREHFLTSTSRIAGRPHTYADSGSRGSGALDSEHRSAMALAAPVRPELQNRPSPISTVTLNVQIPEGLREGHCGSKRLALD
jgi:hypothetical protein